LTTGRCHLTYPNIIHQRTKLIYSAKVPK